MDIRIKYLEDLQGVSPDELTGFFVGWSNPPSPETHLKMLHGSYCVWLAFDEDTQKVIGFISAISDGVLTAFIPFLEVLPGYQRQGIGTTLVRRMLDSLSHLYAVDLVCDDDLQSFYERFELKPYNAMIRRKYEHQTGAYQKPAPK